MIKETISRKKFIMYIDQTNTVLSENLLRSKIFKNMSFELTS